MLFPCGYPQVAALLFLSRGSFWNAVRMFRPALLLCVLCAVAYGCPNIISRSQWGGRKSSCNKPMKTPVPYVVIHHTAGPACTTRSACAGIVKSIQNDHIKQKWCDIGYSFLVGEDGNVYEGRGWTTVGAHAPAMNSKSIGISVIGTYTNRNPKSAALNAVKSLISCGVSKGYIQSNYKLKGHRQVFKTECPGNTFYHLIKTWLHFEA